MATSTYMTFLMHKASGSTTYTKLVDIKDYSDIGGAPETLETTTLTDKMQTFILGIQSNEARTFTCNYDKDDYEKVKALEGTVQHFAIYMGGTEGAGGVITPTGSEGMWKFDGYASVNVGGKGVNEVREMTITIAPSTVDVFE